MNLKTVWYLEKESDHHRVEDPDQLDVEPEAAALQREVCLGPHLTHFECCQNPFSWKTTDQ